MRDLTEKQAAFVMAFTAEPGAIGNASEAARRAGYSKKSAAEIGRQQLEKPAVRAAIDEANRAQISGALASKAVDVLREIVNDKDAPQKLRLDASKTILDRAGFVAPKAEERPQHDSQMDKLRDMNVKQLENFITKNRCP